MQEFRTTNQQTEADEKRQLLSSALYGAAIVSVLWLVKALEAFLNISFGSLNIAIKSRRFKRNIICSVNTW